MLGREALTGRPWVVLNLVWDHRLPMLVVWKGPLSLSCCCPVTQFQAAKKFSPKHFQYEHFIDGFYLISRFSVDEGPVSLN